MPKHPNSSNTQELRQPPSGAEVPVEYSKSEWVIVDLVNDTAYGVTDEEVVAEVRSELLALLDEKGIDPSKVLFSGFPDKGHNKDSFFHTEAQLSEQIQKLSAAANKLYVQGTFDDDPELRDQYATKIQALKDEKGALAAGTADYFFNDSDGLSETRDAMNNPIHFAGISTEATIGVYDPNRMPVGEDASATLSPEAVDAALLLKFHPRYIDSHGNPFES